MTLKHLKRHGSKLLLASPDLEEGFLPEATLMQITLERFIPDPTLDDVWFHRGALGLEGEVDVVPAAIQSAEGNVRKKRGQFHTVSLTHFLGSIPPLPLKSPNLKRSC